MRVWIDTDIGTDVDDALALSYVLRHPDLDLVGVSTVFGDLTIRDAMVRRLLELADVQPASVPLVTGRSVPQTEGRHGLMFGHEGRALLDNPDPVRRIETEPGGDAGAAARIEALAAAIDEAAPDRIVAIGPLTNIGALAVAGFDLPPLTIMGGKFDPDRPSGIAEGRAEWNWYCDPVAVQQVLATGDRLDATVVPAEVTFQTILDPGSIARLADGDQLCRTLASLCAEWLRVQDEHFELPNPRVLLHDPLAAAVLVEPQLCQWTEHTVTVDDRGQALTHQDGVNAGPEGAATIRAAVDVDPPTVAAELLRVLGA